MTGTTGRRNARTAGAGPGERGEDGPAEDGHALRGPRQAGPTYPAPDPGDPVEPRVGDLLAGVRLTAPVGRGGSGQVWAGTEEPGGDRVALKLFHRPGALHEARLLSGLRHPHVLPLRRVVHDPPAVVTDLAEGGSLQAQVAVRGTLSAPEVVTVVAPLADALAFLHGRGVVHGDVSGGNVLFVGRGRPVLADLGSGTLAGAGEASATPGYAAPEVLAGARPGPAADVHGLGAVAWLALTGGVPPAAADRLPLRLLAPECPDGLADVVTAALDPDPAARPSPEDLAGLARSSCVPAAVRLVPAAALGVPPEEAVTYRVREAARQQEGPPHGRRASRRLLVVAGAVGGPVVLAATLAAALPGLTDRAGPSDDGSTSTRPAAARPGPPRPQASPVPAAVHDPAVEPAAGSPVPGADPDPPRGEELAALVRSLVTARQTALNAGDVDALDGVHHDDGDTLQRDRELLADGPVPVTYEVLDVRAVPGRPAAAGVLSRTSSPGGAEITEQVVVVLAVDDDGWQVLTVEQAER